MFYLFILYLVVFTPLFGMKKDLPVVYEKEEYNIHIAINNDSQTGKSDIKISYPCFCKACIYWADLLKRSKKGRE